MPVSTNEARLQAHYASQWLARYGRSYLPPQGDDSHTSMMWNPSARLFLSQSSSKGCLALDIPTLTLFWLDPKGTSATGFSLDGTTDVKVEEILRAMLGEVGLNPKRLDLALPYDLPNHSITEGGTYDVASNAEALGQLAAHFHTAATLLEEVKQRERAAAPVRAWPHHFDIATLITLDDESDSEKAKSIGIGFSPSDDSYDEPYFYISPWPYPDKSALPADPELFQWHTKGFTAAVIPKSMWPDEDVADFIRSGLIEAISASKALLGGQ